MNINRLGVVLISAVTIGSLEVRVAKAADYCISLGPPIAEGTAYVGKRFDLPKADRCSSWEGYCVGCSPDNIQTGTACTSSDGAHVSFQITTAYLLTNRQFDWVRLNLPDQTGSGNLNHLLAPGTTNYSASGGECASSPVPVP